MKTFPAPPPAGSTLFIHPFIQPVIQSFIHSSNLWYNHSSIHPTSNTIIHSFIQPVIQSLIHSSHQWCNIHSFIQLHWYDHAFIHPISDTINHPFIIMIWESYWNNINSFIHQIMVSGSLQNLFTIGSSHSSSHPSEHIAEGGRSIHQKTILKCIIHF